MMLSRIDWKLNKVIYFDIDKRPIAARQGVTTVIDFNKPGLFANLMRPFPKYTKWGPKLTLIGVGTYGKQIPAFKRNLGYTLAHEMGHIVTGGQGRQMFDIPTFHDMVDEYMAWAWAHARTLPENKKSLARFARKSLKTYYNNMALKDKKLWIGLLPHIATKYPRLMSPYVARF